MSEHWIGIFEASRIALRPPNTLRRADDVLHPLRDHAGRRVYSRPGVERWAAQLDRRGDSASTRTSKEHL